ncbi:MAG: glycoside hydrolase 43 family protein, partial [bacterium]
TVVRSCIPTSRSIRGALAFLAGIAGLSSNPVRAQGWSPDAGGGNYKNPIIYADYSDPDAIRVGDDFYMTSSSFASVPGLPILHSRDLVHWTLVNHAIRRLPQAFDVPQHGNGIWAPSIRFHDGAYYIYYGDPDRGIYMVKTRDVLGTWDGPVLVREAKGWIDPCPLWDDDGNAYLVHAFANSRAGVKSILHVNRMSADGTRLLDDGTLVFDGHANHPTIEGPKFYKRNGWYYIFAPAGGVPTGWQTVLRSKHALGPYEDRIVLAQGTSPTNGPHQGAWVELKNGEHWFLHFQDRGAFGRIVHLQPMIWRPDGWPVIGRDSASTGTGEPVLAHRLPTVVGARNSNVPQTSDEFDARVLGQQWQWEANDQPGWYSLTAAPGSLRLFAQPRRADSSSLWFAPNVLMQKIPAPVFTLTTRVSLGKTGDETAGLVVLGMDYAALSLRRTGSIVELVLARVVDAPSGAAESLVVPATLSTESAYLRASCDGLMIRFSYSVDGAAWIAVGDPFTPKAARWVGAKLGLFATRPSSSPGSYADFDFFRIQ